MWIAQIVSVVSLIGIVVTLLCTIKGSKHWLWSTGIFVYIFGFTTLFTIGLLIVPIAFIFWMLALAYSLKLIRNRLHLFITALVGMMVGILCIFYFQSSVYAPLGFIFNFLVLSLKLLDIMYLEILFVIIYHKLYINV